MDISFRVTEWDWLKIQLRLYSLEVRSEVYSVYFDFEVDKPADFECLIFGQHAKVMIDRRASRQEQLEYYLGWVKSEKRRVAEILEHLPSLNKAINPEKNVRYRVMYHNGMGSVTICEFIAGDVLWHVEDPTA